MTMKLPGDKHEGGDSALGQGSFNHPLFTLMNGPFGA